MDPNHRALSHFIKKEAPHIIIGEIMNDTGCIKFTHPSKEFRVTTNEIGRGSRGIVYESCEEKDCDFVAKIIHPVPKKFFNEIICQIKVSEIGLAPMVQEIWKCKDTLLIIMNKLPKLTLQDYLENSKVSDRDKRSMVQKAFVIIDRIHEIGVLHGDCHMQNFIINGEDMMMIDFGDSIYNNSSIKDTLIAATDTHTLRTDIIATFPAQNYLHDTTSRHTVSANNNSLVQNRRSLVLGQRRQTEAVALETAANNNSKVHPQFVIPIWAKDTPETVHLTPKEEVLIKKRIQSIKDEMLSEEHLIELIEKYGAQFSTEMKQELFKRLKAFL
jgi:tRNA A-37 threonylcarbamoyl transferase component Bud32